MNAVIYARYSSDRQREESIEGQLRECTEYANKNNLTLLGTYVDRALSARTADRPDFQRMIADSAKGILMWYWYGNWTAFPGIAMTAPTTSTF